MQLVSLQPLLSDAIFDLRYATDNNVTGQVLYANLEPQLSELTAQKLVRAAELFRQQSLRLVIWDAYRPTEAQARLRQVNPDNRYVAENSMHCLGLAVDVTLADSGGNYLDMGTDFDEFTEKAHINASGLRPKPQTNRQRLQSVMQQAGFQPWHYEWWHFEDQAGLE